MELGGSFFWWPLNIKFFLSFGAGDGISAITDDCPAALFYPACPLEVEIGETRDAWCLPDATMTACVLLRARTNNALVRAAPGVVPVKF